MRVWDEHYSVGNPEVDEQHAHIVDLINAVETAATTGGGASSIDLVIGLLTRYLRTHFATEERLMKAVGYPGLEQHAAQHAWCAGELQRLIESYRAHTSNLDSALNFLRDWMEKHTLSRDLELAEYVRASTTATGTASEPAQS